MNTIKATSLLLLLLTFACIEKPSENPTNTILTQLQSTKGKGILFGHQDDLAYGIDWKYVDGESDVKRISGDYPSLFGWELGGIELDQTVNLDSVPFTEMKRLAIKAHTMGGINTFSWHPYSPINGESSWTPDVIIVKHILPGGSHHDQFKIQLDKLASFLTELKTEKGTAIPFIFRPWHEMDGSWFWWGSESCTPAELKSLFRFTVEYLRDEKGLSQMVVAYSPDCNFNNAEEYKTWYPGDDVIEIMGVDNYADLRWDGGEDEAIRKLHIVIETANKHNKLAAFTETGLENMPDPNWFTQKLGKVLNDSIIQKGLSYVMLWRNDPDVHFFFTYPGQLAADDAKTLLSQPNILLLNDFNQIIKEDYKKE